MRWLTTALCALVWHTANSQTNIWMGGSHDGVAAAGYTNPNVFSIWTGGSHDGAAAASYLHPNQFSIWKGSSHDGAAAASYINPNLFSIWKGGSHDGAAIAGYTTPPPGCPAPYSLSIQDQAPTPAAYLKWQSYHYPDGVTQYEVRGGNNITDPSQAAFTVVGTYYSNMLGQPFHNMYTWMYSLTNFQWWVRDICGPGDTSTWAFYTTAAKTDETVFELQPAHFSIYPNPNKGDVLNVEWSGSAEAQLQLLDATGRLLFHAPLLHQPETLALPQLPQGIYIARLNCAGAVQSCRLIIQP